MDCGKKQIRKHDVQEVTDKNAIEELSKNAACIVCQRTINIKNKNNIFVYCKICEKNRRKRAHELWLRKMKVLYDSCLTCLNIFHNRLSYEKHDCTLEGTFVCDGCDRIFLQKDSIATHVQKCKKIISKFNDTKHRHIDIKFDYRLISEDLARTSELKPYIKSDYHLKSEDLARTSELKPYIKSDNRLKSEDLARTSELKPYIKSDYHMKSEGLARTSELKPCIKFDYHLKSEDLAHTSELKPCIKSDYSLKSEDLARTSDLKPCIKFDYHLKSEDLARTSELKPYIKYEDFARTSELKPCIKFDYRLKSEDFVHTSELKPYIKSDYHLKSEDLACTSELKPYIIVKSESKSGAKMIAQPLSCNNSKGFNCHICKKTFKDNSSLTVHMSVHAEERAYHCTVANKNAAEQVGKNSPRCKLCEKTTINIKSKNKIVAYCQICKKKRRKLAHKLWLRRMKIFYDSCLICLNIFHNRLSYEKHDCTLEGTFVCDGCDRIFLQKESITTHVQKCKKIISKFNAEQKHNGRKYESKLKSYEHSRTSGPSRYNNVKSNSKSRANMNVQSKSTDNLECFSCDICKKEYKSNSCLTRHMRVHTGQKPFKCKICNKLFSKSSYLTIHLRIHTGEKPFKCKICQKMFSDPSGLRFHLRVHTGKKPYRCKTCKKSFAMSHHLTNHLRVHTGEKPFECKFCSKSFSQSLTRHMHIHTGVSRYKCKICSKLFSGSQHLTSHMRLHTGEKPFKCNICHKKFSDSSNCRSHVRAHTSKKTIKCKICSKLFLRTSHLTSHMRVHTGEKRFKCRICNKLFSHSHHLTYHFRREHAGEKRFKCNICQRMFSDSSSLSKHSHVHTWKNNSNVKSAKKSLQ